MAAVSEKPFYRAKKHLQSCYGCSELIITAAGSSQAEAMAAQRTIAVNAVPKQKIKAGETNIRIPVGLFAVVCGAVKSRNL